MKVDIYHVILQSVFFQNFNENILKSKIFSEIGLLARP